MTLLYVKWEVPQFHLTSECDQQSGGEEDTPVFAQFQRGAFRQYSWF